MSDRRWRITVKIMHKTLVISTVVALTGLMMTPASATAATPAHAPGVARDTAVTRQARTPKPHVTVGRCSPRKKPARGYVRTTVAADAARTDRLRVLDAWAYLGPRAGVARGKVTVQDRKGCVVARGVTTATGTFAVPFRRTALPRLPLTVKVKGGTAAGKRFHGTMRARVFTLAKRAPTTQISVVSTAASRMADQHRGYARSWKQAMRSLGFSRTAQSWSLQFRNSHVGYRQLIRKIRRADGGVDGFTKQLARHAKSGQRIKGLRPSSATASGPKRYGAQQVSAAAAADSSVCDVAVPTSGTSPSEQIVANVAAIGIGGLLEYAGTPATSAEGITGMLLSPLGAGSEETVQQDDVNAVMSELTCISEQIGYLSDQLAYMQYTIDISGSEQCASDVSTYFYDYNQLLNNASQFPINAQNTSLLDDLPQWDGLNTSCAEDVNDSLFGTAGGEASAWQQLNENYSSGVEWYTQWQVQALQANLQYWGTILYQAFVLENEYYNFYGQWENADIIAGGSNASGDSPVCASGSLATSPNYCVYQSNITAAFPDDLYSDEIGIISSGTGVNAIPGGMVAFPPNEISGSALHYIQDTNADANQFYTPTAMTGPYWYNMYLSGVEYSPSQWSGSPPVTIYATGVFDCDTSWGGCLPTGFYDFASEASRYFNLETYDPVGDEYQINPNGYGSAVQTFWNPQNTNRASVSWSEVSELGQDGPPNSGSSTDKMAAEQVFYDAINQTPAPYPSEYADGGAWSQFSESSASYWTDDTTSSIWLQATAVLGDFDITASIAAPLGNRSGWKVTDQNSIPNTPIFAFLSGRTWWPGSSSASTFEPPNPPTS